MFKREVKQLLAFVVSSALLGCSGAKPKCQFLTDCTADCHAAQLAIDDPCLECDVHSEDYSSASPFLLGTDRAPPFRELSLEEAVELALANSPVMRDLGGRVLRDPAAARTRFDPALQETDPRFGVEAALSAFDASFATGMFWENNDRALNNIFEGGGTRLWQQDSGLYNFELRKRSAVGTQMALRHVLDYDYNNAPGNNIPNLPWGTWVEGEVRQPLWRGAGVNFNRIAGPDSVPGVNTGVLVARVNTDIALAEFETSVHELVSSVENAYWELYFAYRDLDAKMAARQRALETWREVHTYFQTGRLGGAADQEAQAREQYFRLEAEVQTALAGKVVEKTNANVFRGIGGVHYLERRLRFVTGLPANDGMLLRPSNEPSLAPIEFDWQTIVAESLARRVELRKQKWVVRRRELELSAANGHVQPQLDAVGRYRFRGLGHDLTGSDGTSFDSAYGNMTDGDFKEWMLGAELSIPLGYRRELSGVRNAELRLIRDRAVLHEQEREVISDLSAVYSESKRAYLVAQTNYNRRAAAHQQLQSLKALFANADENEKIRLLDLLLDSQRRLADAESQYFRAVAEYAFAIKNIHYEKGSLLDYYGIQLAEGPWPSKACFDATRRERSRHSFAGLTQFIPNCPPIVSRGPTAEHSYTSPTAEVQEERPYETSAVTRLPPDNG